MALFPQLGPQYYNEAHKDLIARMETFYSESITTNYAFWGESDLDERFFGGDQTVLSDVYGNLPVHRRRNFTFNRIRRIVNMVSGHQRRNRKSTVIVPVENGDNITADQFTKIMYWLNQHEGVLETISESFEGALITGMNLLNVWIDYRDDPVSGMIKVDNCAYNSFLIDPFFKKPDLSDCNGLWKRSFVSKREAISLLPDYADEIVGLWGTESGTGRDGKFQFMPESYGYSYKNLLTYDEFYYRTYRTKKLLVDTNTGETFEWKSQEEDRLKLFLQSFPMISIVEQDVPTVHLAIVVQGKVIYDGPNPLGIDRYPFVPVFAYYHPELPYFPYRIQGMVRGMRDAQYLYNRRRIIELDMLESQMTSGWIYKENALVNPKDVFLSGQGKGLALKEEATMADVQPIQPPQIPPSMIQLSELLAREIMEVSGVNEELLGSAIDDKAGILSMLRQGAGLTTLQKLFDQLDYSQKLLGSIILEVIQENFTPGKVQRIINSEPSPQFYNKNFGTYCATVEEGVNTTTQKQLQLIQLLNLREIGVPIPDEVILDASTIQNKEELKEKINEQLMQNNQNMQLKSQLEVAEVQSRINLANARATADEGLGIERISRVAENKELAKERRAAEMKEKETALLERVKILKELESMDLAHLEKLLALSQALEPATNNEDVPVGNVGS